MRLKPPPPSLPPPPHKIAQMKSIPLSLASSSAEVLESRKKVKMSPEADSSDDTEMAEPHGNAIDSNPTLRHSSFGKIKRNASNEKRKSEHNECLEGVEDNAIKRDCPMEPGDDD